MSNLKENVYTCGTCKWFRVYAIYDVERYSCGVSGETTTPRHACGEWTDPDEPDPLTDDEKREIIGDRKAHEIMEEGGERI